MLNPRPEHPAANPHAAGKVCADPRCATLLDDDAEICDECAGTRLIELEEIGARLCGWDGDRAVVFAVPDDRPSIIGRSAGEHMPDIDLRRFQGSDIVHRRHARIERNGREWLVMPERLRRMKLSRLARGICCRSGLSSSSSS
jgi:hypothetical protein